MKFTNTVKGCTSHTTDTGAMYNITLWLCRTDNCDLFLSPCFWLQRW